MAGLPLQYKSQDMENLKFRTTIKCSGCVANVTSALNETVGAENWNVDIQNPEKILTITKDESISEEQVIKAVQKAGYKAERLD